MRYVLLPVLWIAILLRRLVILGVLFVLLLGIPVGYVELACRGTAVGSDYEPLLAEEHRRPETRAYTGYADIYMANARAEYARTVASADPHEYRFLPAAIGYWTMLCPLARKAAEHGGLSTGEKVSLYASGAAFTGGTLLKGAYEETVGRILTLSRGPERAPLDTLSAAQEARYAASLQSAPWHDWNFAADANALWAAKTDTPRDWERAIALNIEYRARGFAALLAKAAPGEAGGRTTRAIVTGVEPEALGIIAGLTVVGETPQGTEIEAPRGPAFTSAATSIAAAGGDFVEIAGNDDILLAVQASPGQAIESVAQVERGASAVYLVDLKVADLGARLRELSALGRIERIGDY